MNPSGGPEVLYWLTPPKVKVVGDGSSIQKPLYIHHSSTTMLEGVEMSWIYEHFSGSNEIMDTAWADRITIRTEQIGKRIFDIAALSMPDGSKRTAYFDVTRYRKWPTRKPILGNVHGDSTPE